MRSAPIKKWFSTLFVGSLLISCGPPELEEVDKDGDGFTISQGDCNDFDPETSPAAIDVCDGQDNNCNFKTDEVDDKDQDGSSNCNGGDCDDLNPAVEPGADEVFDNLDNDCNCVRDVVGDTNGDGLICGPGDVGVDDDPRAFDNDGDGFCEGIDNDCQDGSQAGDCDDVNPLLSPGSIEVQADNADNDCDGLTDDEDPPVACDSGLNPADPFSFAKAIGLGCVGEVQSAEFITPSNAQARAIVSSYGNGGLDFPFEGESFIILSTGIATSTGNHSGGGDENFGNTKAHPDPKRPCDDNTDNDSDGSTDFPQDPQCSSLTDFDETNAITCGVGDELQVNDYVEYRIVVKPPPNANGFSYRLQFLSGEYPGFHCTQFDDSFFALLSSQGFNGNISFDANGGVLSINSGFFQICDVNDEGNICVENTSSLAGTGFEGSGGTKSLVTTVPSIEPGIPFTLQFIIFDEGDGSLDSSVLIDSWQWIGIPCEDDPLTPNNECDPVTIIP